MRAPLVEHASGDQNRKSAFAIRRCRGDRLHSVPHPPFGLPPCVSKRRLVALSRCPDADCILPASAIGWNGTKVWNVINRDLVSKISGQNKTQGSPRHTTPFESRAPLACIKRINPGVGSSSQEPQSGVVCIYVQARRILWGLCRMRQLCLTRTEAI